MDRTYQQHQQRARRLEDQVKDMMDDHNHPQARLLHEEFRRLTEDFEQQKNPRSIEARMNTIERQLQQAEHSNDRFMNVNHVTGLQDHVRDWKQEVRKFPHY